MNSSDIIYVIVLLLIAIAVFWADIKLIEYMDKGRKTIIHHVKKTTNIVRKSLTKRQKPENKGNGPSFEDGV